MGYAFISYSSKKQASADAIRNLFNKKKIDTWMAPYDIPAGSSYMGEINRAIKGCSCFVLILSEAAQSSHWVRSELERALSYNKTIVSVKIENVILNDDFEFAISSRQVTAIQKVDESSEEVKKILNSVITCTGVNAAIDDKKTEEVKAEPEAAEIRPQSEHKATINRGANDFVTYGNVLVQYNGSDNRVFVPDGIEKIADKAFLRCLMEEVILPDSLKTIGNEAFGSCEKLKKIHIPDSVTSIGEFAFSSCTELTDIKLSKGITKIPQFMLNNCRSIQELLIPGNIRYIGNSAFCGCVSLHSIKLPDGLILLGETAFEDCISLETIHIPDSVSEIKHDCFMGCRALREINLPSALKVISASLLAGTGIRALDIPDNVIEIKESAFNCCKSLESINFNKKLRRIGLGAFMGCKSLKSVELPESVGFIDNNVFEDCSSLKSVIIHSSDNTLGEGLFSGCVSLEELTLPIGLKNISESTFELCYSLRKIIVPSDSAELLKEVLDKCNHEVKPEIIIADEVIPINVPEGIFVNDGVMTVSSMGYIHDSFLHRNQDFNTVHTLFLGHNITEITWFAFFGMKNLRKVVLPKNLKRIRNEAFSGCINLDSVVIPEGTEIIEYDAFKGCTNLRSISIPDSVKYIGVGAFDGCSLNNVTVSKDCKVCPYNPGIIKATD